MGQETGSRNSEKRGKGTHSLGRGLGSGELERPLLFFFFQMAAVPTWPILWVLLDYKRGPLIPGTGSERREEDSFDSDSTATLLK